MSRGLGVEQRGVLAALQREPARWWRRAELQHAAWGQRRRDYQLQVPEGDRRHHWIKNVVWWRDHKVLTEGNFTRALRSLERRSLLVRHPSGRSYRLMSDEAVTDARALAASMARSKQLRAEDAVVASYECRDRRRKPTLRQILAALESQYGTG